MKKIINTVNAPAPIGPYNQAIEVDGTIYVSGQIALDVATGLMRNDTVQTETTQVMKNINAILESAQYTMSDIVKATIYITDMSAFPEINEVYGSFFTADFPARETVEVSALPKSARVEISVIAIK